MAKDFVVIFTDEVVRVEKDPSLVAIYKGQPNVLFNPELPKGVSPDKWVKNGKRIDVKEDTRGPSTDLNKSLQDFKDVTIKSLKMQNLVLKIISLTLGLTIGVIYLLHKGVL